jgi:uncharacterized protein
MYRILFYLIVFAGVYWLLRYAFLPKKFRPPASGDKGEEMIQDPVCQCYVPRSQAHVLSYQNQKIFFCSEECRRKYMAAHGLPSDP